LALTLPDSVVSVCQINGGQRTRVVTKALYPPHVLDLNAKRPRGCAGKKSYTNATHSGVFQLKSNRRHHLTRRTSFPRRIPARLPTHISERDGQLVVNVHVEEKDAPAEARTKERIQSGLRYIVSFRTRKQNK